MPARIVFPRRADWRLAAGGAVIVAMAAVVYARTFSVPLLFDDATSIVENPTIRHLSTAFWPPAATTVSGRPVLNLSLAVNHAISGTAVWSYHALNLAVHVLAGLTLFGIVRRTLRLRSGQALRLPSGQALAPSDTTLVAFAASLLWTLHPLQTESVTYVIQRAESLMGLFYLLTLYCFIRGVCAEHADASGPRAGRASWVWFVLSVASCLLGMATKEVMVSAPLIVLLYDRTFVAGAFRGAWHRHRGLYVALAATWMLLAALVAHTGWDRGGTSGFDGGVSPWTYWLTQFQAVTRYLWLSVWPHPLVFEYGPVRVDRWGDVIPGALVVVPLAATVLLALWRWPVWGFMGSWFFLILAPTSVMPGKLQMVVEHRMYLPLAAVMVLVAIGIHEAVRQRSWIVFAVLALGLGALTARRNQDYQTAAAIWGDTVARRPDNVRARYNLGAVLAQMPGRLADAIAEYEQAVRLQPDYFEAHNNLGILLTQMPGQLVDAIVHFEAALRLMPDSARAHNNLANALAQMPGRMADAIAEYEHAVRLQPDYVEALSNMGAVLEQMPGRLADAVAEYEQVVRLRPDYAPGWHNLGAALYHLGDLPAAAAAFREEVRLSPDDPAARQALTTVLEQAREH
jgi:protein O-mannosyl-transferase